MSPLHVALTEYLATRRALGTQLGWPESSLRGFVDFVEAEGEEFVTTDLAVRWAVQAVGVQRATHARRLAIVRGFAAWLQATDPRTQVPPKGFLPAGQRRPTPHIYSDREISDLMAAAGRLGSASGLRGGTYRTLVGLLAATGLRPGEALALDIGDVDLVGGVLTVRESKFGKSRFVPLEESARAALAAYAIFRDRVRVGRDTPAFLVSGRDRVLSQAGFGGHSASSAKPSVYARDRTPAALGMVLGFRTSATHSRPAGLSSGTAPVLTWTG